MPSDDDYDQDTAVNWETKRSSAAIELIRARLGDAGFLEANACGDLRRGDVWVFTAYTAGEWFVSVQDRSNRANPRHSVRINDHMIAANPNLLDATVEWALGHGQEES